MAAQNLELEEDVSCPQFLSEKGLSFDQYISSGICWKFFKAYSNQLPNKELVVKLIDLSKAPKFWTEKCLLKNMKVLTKLNNPNIAKVYHLVKTHKTAFIFMD
jgi:hypothetical protein